MWTTLLECCTKWPSTQTTITGEEKSSFQSRKRTAKSGLIIPSWHRSKRQRRFKTSSVQFFPSASKQECNDQGSKQSVLRGRMRREKVQKGKKHRCFLFTDLVSQFDVQLAVLKASLLSSSCSNSFASSYRSRASVRSRDGEAQETDKSDFLGQIVNVGNVGKVVRTDFEWFLAFRVWTFDLNSVCQKQLQTICEKQKSEQLKLCCAVKSARWTIVQLCSRCNQRNLLQTHKQEPS